MLRNLVSHLLSCALLLAATGCTDPPSNAGNGAPTPSAETPAAPSGERAVDGDSVAVLRELQAARKIVDVHEHIMSMNDVPVMLETMDAMGIAKTVLMGSSWFTITLREQAGFTRYDENNAALLEIVRAHPDRFEAWPTLNPEDPEKLAKLKAYVSQGATGVKLYIGHGYVRRDNGEYMFHTRAMDDPEMMEVYAYCEENYIPVCMHVNPHYTKPGFAQEFIAVLSMHPDLKIVAPHFILSSSWNSRFQQYMDTFPNLYTDCSYGDSFMVERLRWTSKNPNLMRKLFEKYQDRIMFGCDLVVTDYPTKTADWATSQMQAYLDMLTKARYTSEFILELDERKRPIAGELEELTGLQLPGPILEKVLYKNYEAMMASQPEGTEIARDIDWAQMRGSKKIRREPGQAFPPPEN